MRAQTQLRRSKLRNQTLNPHTSISSSFCSVIDFKGRILGCGVEEGGRRLGRAVKERAENSMQHVDV